MLFFFQAEDGIRDKLVTGVQTCALPISPRKRSACHVSSQGYIHVCVIRWRSPRAPTSVSKIPRWRRRFAKRAGSSLEVTHETLRIRAHCILRDDNPDTQPGSPAIPEEWYVVRTGAARPQPE